MNENVMKLAKWIEESNNIVVLTGAGMSTESGIPDFRSSGGIYAGGNVEHYISRYYYNRNPKVFWKHFKEIFKLKLMGNYLPNEGHLFLKELEEQGKNVTVLTQNIDGLHQKAGSSRVIEMHGTLQTGTCPKCKTKYELSYLLENEIPRCNRPIKDGTCNFILDTDVVLFGDGINGFSKAEEALDECELFITMGTSLEVYPVNNIPQYARYDWETKLAIINKEQTKKDQLFHLTIQNGIGETVKEIKSIMQTNK